MVVYTNGITFASILFHLANIFTHKNNIKTTFFTKTIYKRIKMCYHGEVMGKGP